MDYLRESRMIHRPKLPPKPVKMIDREFNNPLPNLMCKLWKLVSPEQCIKKLLKEKRK